MSHMGNIHIKIIISVCQRQSVDAVGEAMKFKRNACFCQCSAQYERVSGIIAVGLPDEEDVYKRQLQNFEFLFKTKDAWIMIRNTLLYNIVWIAMGTVIAVFIAILMAEISARPAAKVIQPIICFPSMISAVILSFIVYAFLLSLIHIYGRS